MKGLFITFEGIEGCGKSTQVELLRRRLEELKIAVEVTREPGGTFLAEKIRHLLLDPGNGGMCAITELLLYEAARAQHVQQRIRPALEAGKVVLCDRFADSTTVYQGAGRGISAETLADLHRIATAGVWPDRTLVLDVPVEVGLTRVRAVGALDRMEQESHDFHERVREGFLRLAREEPERVRVIDGAQPVDEVAEQVHRAVMPLIKRR